MGPWGKGLGRGEGAWGGVCRGHWVGGACVGVGKCWLWALWARVDGVARGRAERGVGGECGGGAGGGWPPGRPLGQSSHGGSGDRGPRGAAGRGVCGVGWRGGVLGRQPAGGAGWEVGRGGARTAPGRVRRCRGGGGVGGGSGVGTPGRACVFSRGGTVSGWRARRVPPWGAVGVAGVVAGGSFCVGRGGPRWVQVWGRPLGRVANLTPSTPCAMWEPRGAGRSHPGRGGAGGHGGRRVGGPCVLMLGRGGVAASVVVAEGGGGGAIGCWALGEVVGLWVSAGLGESVGWRRVGVWRRGRVFLGGVAGGGRGGGRARGEGGAEMGRAVSCVRGVGFWPRVGVRGRGRLGVGGLFGL